MRIYSETSLRNFEPWLYNERLLDDFEAVLEDLYPDGITELTEEIDSVKEHMTELMEEYNNDINEYEEMEGGLANSDKEEIWNVSYKEEYEDLARQLEELKEEEETYLS